MKKICSSLFICAMLIMLAAICTTDANAQLSPGTGMPVSGFSSPGITGQGVPAGAFGQGPVTGGIQTVPGGFAPGQQQGTGIWIGERDIRPTGTLPGGMPGGQTCQCIRAPCYCQEPGPLNFPGMSYPAQYQPYQTQPGQVSAVYVGNPVDAGPRS